MKLFVWESVLNDYSDGIAFALAHDEEEAKRLIGDKWAADIDSRNREAAARDFINDNLTKQPRVYEAPVGYYLFGGG